MKYIEIETVRTGSGDMFTAEFDSRADAITKADQDWHHLTVKEKKQKTVYVLESVNPDEDAENHMDGNIIWEDGKEQA